MSGNVYHANGNRYNDFNKGSDQVLHQALAAGRYDDYRVLSQGLAKGTLKQTTDEFGKANFWALPQEAQGGRQGQTTHGGRWGHEAHGGRWGQEGHGGGWGHGRHGGGWGGWGGWGQPQWGRRHGGGHHQCGGHHGGHHGGGHSVGGDQKPGTTETTPRTRTDHA